MQKTAVIIGGGISGLTSAYFLAKKGYKVHVVEKNKELGGLLRSFDYGEHGHFDYGAHNILETGIDDLDEFYLSLLASDDWQITRTLNGQTRALTGLLYRDKLQQNSPFIDLRNHPKVASYIGDFFLNIEKHPKPSVGIECGDADSYSRYLFGDLITDDIIVPALQKLYGKKSTELNAMVLHLTQFTRIGLFEESIMQELVTTRIIGSRLAYTEQLSLPDQYGKSLKSFYPKKYGIYRVIDAIKVKLDELGIAFHMEETITDITIKNNKINQVSIGNNLIKADVVISTIGFSSLVGLLSLDVRGLSFDKAPQTVMTNILIDKPLKVGELSFIYSYDKGSNIFRLDNYQNYCQAAKRKGGYAITIESLLLTDKLDDDKLQFELIKELKHYQLIEDDTQINFIKTERIIGGFPMLSQNNINIINNLREQVSKLAITNLITVGVLSEVGLFFENQVVQDMYYKIKDLS